MPSTRLTRRRLLRSIPLLAAGAGCNARPEGSTTRSRPDDADGTGDSGPTDAPPTSPDDGTPAPEPIDSRLAGPWPTFGRGPGNTATTDASGPTAPVDAFWTRRLGSVGTLYPAVGPAGPYLASRRGSLVALDEAGDVRWRRALDDEVASAPIATRDRVVVGTVSGAITAFSPDGEEAWSVDLSEGLFAPHASDGTVFAAGEGVVIVAHRSEGVVAVDRSDGTRLWTTPLSGRIHRPRVADGTVYVSTDPQEADGAVVALSLAAGTERWRAAVPRGAAVAPTVTAGTVYTGTHRGLVLAFDRDGTERWRTSVDDWVSTTPVVASDAVWVGTLDGRLIALGTDGERRATYDIELTTPVVRDGVLYAGSGEGVVAFDTTGAVRWRTSVDGHVRPPLRLADDRLYVGADDGDAYALDPATGDARWTFTDRPATVPSPVVDDRSVYVGGLGGSLHGIVAESGKDLWRPGFAGEVIGTPAVLAGGVVAGLRGRQLTATAPLDYGDPPRDPIRATPRPSTTETPVAIDLPEAERRWSTGLGGVPTDGVGFADGVAYVPLGDELASVAAATGEVRWHAAVDGRVTTTPAVAGGGVVVGGSTGVSAFETDDGRRRWHAGIGTVRSSPAVRDGLVVVGGDDGVVRALSLVDGTERWRVETGGPVLSSPALTPDVAVVGSDDGIVRALTLAEGTERWRVETGAAVRSSPAVADGTAFVGSRDRHLYALSVADGTERWRHELDGWVDGSPAVAHGAVFVTDQSGACYCLATRIDG